jgi:hypothetical protein
MYAVLSFHAVFVGGSHLSFSVDALEGVAVGLGNEFDM